MAHAMGHVMARAPRASGSGDWTSQGDARGYSIAASTSSSGTVANVVA